MNKDSKMVVGEVFSSAIYSVHGICIQNHSNIGDEKKRFSRIHVIDVAGDRAALQLRLLTIDSTTYIGRHT